MNLTQTATMNEREAPGDDEVFDGWRVRWTSRRRPYFAEQRDPGNPIDWDRGLVELHEPVLMLTKPGRKWVEVKGQSDIDRPVMLARGMTAAMLCDMHYAQEWGDFEKALYYGLEAERWHRLAQVRTNAQAVARATGVLFSAGPAGAGAKGT
jgi:hypothetical protein